jgi:S1-C subfamily serine protease
MKTASSLTKRIMFAIFCFTFACFCGCQSPVQNLNKRLAQVDTMSLPINARAEIMLPLDKQDSKFVSGYGYGVRLLDNSASLIKAAKEDFGRVFKDVEASEKISEPHFIIKVNPDVKADFYWATFEVTLDCEIAYGSGEHIASYKAHAKEVGFVIDQSVVDKTYLKAFGDIVIQMLDDPTMSGIIAQGPDSTKTKQITDTIQEASEYSDLVEGVVTIEMKKKVNWATSPLEMHGSGFFIDSDGTILTNNHVIKDINTADSAKVLYKNNEYNFVVVARDPWSDLALVKVKGFDNTPKLSIMLKNYPVAVGDEVVVVGSPLAKELERSVSRGIISAFRDIHGVRLIQTDAAVNGGNSGGPLVHLKTRKVIGVMRLAGSGEGLGFAVPADTIHEFLAKNRDKYVSSVN